MKTSRFSEDQVVKILDEGDNGEQIVDELCRKHGIHKHYYGGIGGETRTYNSLKQLTNISSGTYLAPMSIAYNYPSTGNNGKISSQQDMVSGEIVSYTYDALNRLATAENQSTFSTPWGQGFTYDGFGNLTKASVIQGSAPSLTTTYDYKNHAGGEDANGNPGYVPLPAYGTSGAATYDVENRLAVIGGVTCPDGCYSYAPGNKRVWRGVWASSGATRTTDTITFWSVSGQKLGDYALTEVSGGIVGLYATQLEVNYYFGSRLLKNNNGWVYSDRLASIGKFYPYGQERPSATTNGTEKFTSKERDSETGNDFFGARYFSSAHGRFTSVDPSRLGAFSDDPQTWNRYSYAHNNPLRYVDKNGKWPTEIHNQIIYEAFRRILSPDQIKILEDVSAAQDFLISGQSMTLAYEHAMRAPWQSVDDARAQFSDFVKSNEDQATQIQVNFWKAGNPGISDSALISFARALHAILDSTSPAHAGFQVWDWRDLGSDRRHRNAEARITSQQLSAAISAAHAAFSNTFGQQAALPSRQSLANFGCWAAPELRRGPQPRVQAVTITALGRSGRVSERAPRRK
jgi:RHS repeat-associated protein